MNGLGKATLVPVGGYIHLAHRTAGGLQLSIENWADISRAMMAFSSADIEVEPSVYLTAAQVRLIGALASGSEIPNKRGMKGLAGLGMVSGPWRKKTDRPSLTARGLAAAGVLFP